MALKDKRIPQDFELDERVAEAIRTHLEADKLPCARAFVIAKQLEVEPLTVGRTADALQIHLTRCQLGLFGYPDKKKGWATTPITELPIPEGLEDAIRAALDESGHLACATAWEVAARFAIPRMLVGYVADQIGVRIAPCQLGAF